MFEKNGRPVVFGEVLFDMFEDGSAALGGAAFNVAWHLQGFGLRPLLISRIGQDEYGEMVLMRMQQWGMDTQTMQIDPTFPTGCVKVSIKNNEPEYEIPPDQAYDKISGALVVDLVTNLPCSVLYCGSLAQRDPVSRKTLQRLLLEQQLPLYFDINRRSPWIDEITIDKTLNAAKLVKMNVAELAAQTGLLVNDDNSVRHAVELLCKQHNIEHVYITRSDNGACYIGNTGIQVAIAHKVTKFVDSVGAGDAFSAVCLLGKIKQWPIATILARANIFASMVCEQHGPIIEDKSVYASMLQEWA